MAYRLRALITRLYIHQLLLQVIISLFWKFSIAKLEEQREYLSHFALFHPKNKIQAVKSEGESSRKR